MAFVTLRQLRTYLHNVFKQVLIAVRRQQTWREAAAGVSRDTKKLGAAFGVRHADDAGRKQAVRLVRRGREEYNTAQYAAAEKLFEQAVDLDPGYAWAHLYLGHALYKQNRLREAEAAWRRAADVEPKSEAAAKARKKLQHSKRSVDSAVQDLHERFRE